MSTASSPSESDDLRVPRRGWALPDHMREQLRMPFGKLTEEKEMLEVITDCRNLVTVGDVVSTTLLQKGVCPDILIFDYKTKRGETNLLKEMVDGIEGKSVVVSNPAGCITPQLVVEAKKAMSRKGRTKMRVKGEEDLAALVCVALAPSGTCLVYGLPDEGMVLVRIDRETSARAKSLIYAMEELN